MALRGDVRNLVEELRDALVDLRSDVSETQGVDHVLRSFLERVNRRNRLAVTLTAEADARLPLSVEREFWRVAQEAVMNAERHAHASNVVRPLALQRRRGPARGVRQRCRDDGR